MAPANVWGARSSALYEWRITNGMEIVEYCLLFSWIINYAWRKEHMRNACGTYCLQEWRVRAENTKIDGV